MVCVCVCVCMGERGQFGFVCIGGEIEVDKQLV